MTDCHHACFQLTDDPASSYPSYRDDEASTPAAAAAAAPPPPPQQTAEALLLKSALAVPLSNRPYIAFYDDFVVEHVEEQQESSPQQQQPSMAAIFDVASYEMFGPDDNWPSSDTLESRPSLSMSSSSHTQTSDASHDTTTTATTATTVTVAPTLSSQSFCIESSTSLEVGEEGEDDDESDEEEDTTVDDSDSDSDDLPPLPPLLSLLRTADGTLGIQNLVDEASSEQAVRDALQWTDVAPPAALLEVPEVSTEATEPAEPVPELLRAIIASSVESIQGQVSGLKAAVAAWQEERRAEAEAEAEREHEVEAAETEAPAAKGKGKGKAVERGPTSGREATSSRESMADSVATLRPPPPRTTTTTTTTATKRSKLKEMASRLRRLRGGNGESSSSSSQGTAAATAAAAAAAIQRHNQMMASRDATPGFKWVRRDDGPNWELVPEDADRRDGRLSTAPASASWRKTTLLAMVQLDVDRKRGVVTPATVECISCFEDVPAKQAVPTVCHAYCLDCFGRLVATAVANDAQFPPKCCLNAVPAAIVQKYAPPDVVHAYTNKTAELALPVADRVYCPVVDCGVWVPPSHVSTAARTAHCPRGHETCTACRQPTHGPQNREECPEASAQDRRDQQLTDDLADEQGWRRCTQCAVLVEHRDACQHMTCRCGAQFCYVCGLRWRTCDCSMDDLRAHKDGTAARQRAREARRQQADRELQEMHDAVAAVAAFQQRERQQLAAKRQRQLRRLHDLQRAREAELREATAQKYDDLQTRLAALTAAQRDKASTARRAERAAQRAAHTQERRELAARHDDERAVAHQTAAAAVADAEAAWAADYRARLRLEQRLEAAYARKLQDSNANANNAKALTAAYQRNNDKRLDAYLQWRDRALAHARYAAAEARDVRAEVLDSLQRKHRRTQRAETRALARRHCAERAWCVLAAAEAARLLAEAAAVEQGLGLAGSSAETDAELLRMLAMEEAGRFAGGGSGIDGDDDDSNHMCAVMLENMVGVVDDDEVEADHDGTADENWGVALAL